MKITTTIYPILGLLLAGAGCNVPLQSQSVSSFVVTNPPPSSVSLRARQPADVPVISTPPARPFVEIGFIEGQGTSFADRNEVLADMRRTAGQHGCGALLITGPNNVVSGLRGDTTTYDGYHGICLAFTDGVAPTATAVPAPPTLLFRDASGNVYRVQESERSAVQRLGWIEIESPK